MFFYRCWAAWFDKSNAFSGVLTLISGKFLRKGNWIARGVVVMSRGLAWAGSKVLSLLWSYYSVCAGQAWCIVNGLLSVACCVVGCGMRVGRGVYHWVCQAMLVAVMNLWLGARSMSGEFCVITVSYIVCCVPHVLLLGEDAGG